MAKRITIAFAADTPLDFEAELALRQAERQSKVLRRANELEKEGFDTLAVDLRITVEMMNLANPLKAVWEERTERPKHPTINLAEESNLDEKCPLGNVPKSIGSPTMKATNFLEALSAIKSGSATLSRLNWIPQEISLSRLSP